MIKTVHQQVFIVLKLIVVVLGLYGRPQTTFGQVVKTDGAAGSDTVQTKPRPRGMVCVSSLPPNSGYPLYILDGVAMSADSVTKDFLHGRDPLHGIDPKTIMSVNLLQDDYATAIYGIRGECGVILVTTKKSKKR